MMRMLIVLAMVFCFIPAVLAQLPPVNDGYAHGDPPYLLEDGWQPLLNGRNLDGWELQNPMRGTWGTTKGVFWGGPEDPTRITAKYGPGDRIYNTMNGTTSASNIYTAEKFGDVELYLEFMVSDKSNSGVYLQGLYEVQIWDSYNRDNPIEDTCGIIYNFNVQVNNEWVGAVAPLVRAERPTGQWQSYHIWFQAPRFDAAGNKISNAKFLRVLHNGILIHENVERKAATRAPMEIPEAALNPLMLQGDHGPVAFRNIYIRPLRPIAE